MHRCLQLARMAEGNVAPNPMVGAILVHEDRVIGEGFHQKYGEAHAEVNCINAVKEEDQNLISSATLYVSLEPCVHFGKTPPCADFIIKNKISKVVVGCRDPFIEVNGKGIEKLIEAGVDVTIGVLQKECIELNKRFFTFHTQHRPYLVLKWAQTADGKIASISPHNRLMISNEYTNRMVHGWRNNEMAILVGTNTAINDDPELTTRLVPGKNPVRLVVDMELRLPFSLKIFNNKAATIVFNLYKHSLPFEKVSVAELENMGIAYYQVTEDVSLVHQITNALYQLGIQSLIVEGGAYLLQSFIDENLWDEVRVITNEELLIGEGLPAPELKNCSIIKKENLLSDSIRIFAPLNS